jgi:hypothetical protein
VDRGIDGWKGGDIMDGMALETASAYATRRQRRKAVCGIVAALLAIRDAERACLLNTPECFQGTDSFESGELAADALSDAIDTLSDAY